MIKYFSNAGDVRRIKYKGFGRWAKSLNVLWAPLRSPMLTPESPWKVMESSRQPNLTLEHGKSPVCEWFACCFSAIGRWGCRRVIDSNSCQSTQLELVSPAFRNVEWHGAVLWTWPEHYTLYRIPFFKPKCRLDPSPGRWAESLRPWTRGTRSLSIIFLVSRQRQRHTNWATPSALLFRIHTDTSQDWSNCSPIYSMTKYMSGDPGSQTICINM